VLLNLGDAPYLDEILSDSTQQQEHGGLLADLDDGGTNPSKPADSPGGACCAYQLLLSLQGVTSNSVPWTSAGATEVFPPEEFLFIVSTLSDRIDRPPRRLPLVLSVEM